MGWGDAEWRRACDAHVAAIERTQRVSGQWRRSVHAEKEASCVTEVVQLAGIDGISDKRIPCPRHERPRSGECLEWMLYCTSSMPRLWLLCAKAAAQVVPNLESPIA